MKEVYSSLVSRGSGRSRRNSFRSAATSCTLCSSSSCTSMPRSNSSRSWPRDTRGERERGRESERERERERDRERESKELFRFLVHTSMYVCVCMCVCVYIHSASAKPHTLVTYHTNALSYTQYTHT